MEPWVVALVVAILIIDIPVTIWVIRRARRRSGGPPAGSVAVLRRSRARLAGDGAPASARLPGQGTLLLTTAGLGYGPLHLSRDRIVGAGAEDGLDGGRVLRVRFVDGTGQEDAAAWHVDDADGWAQELAPADAW